MDQGLCCTTADSVALNQGLISRACDKHHQNPVFNRSSVHSVLTGSPQPNPRLRPPTVVFMYAAQQRMEELPEQHYAQVGLEGRHSHGRTQGDRYPADLVTRGRPATHARECVVHTRRDTGASGW
jgi:hypothetical protein